MPRNAAEKLINDEECLPNIKTTTKPATATKKQQNPKQKQKQKPDEKKQTTQPEQRKRRGQRSKKSKKLKQRKTAEQTQQAAKTATKTPANSQTSKSTGEPPTTATTATTPSKVAANTPQKPPRKRPSYIYVSTAIPTLYPTVIKKCEEHQEDSGDATSPEVTKKPVPAVASKSTSKATTTLAPAVGSKTGGAAAAGRHLRKRRSNASALRKRKGGKRKQSKQFNAKIAKRESCPVRLASLRTRKGAKETPTPLQLFWEQGYKQKLKNQIAWEALSSAILNNIEKVEWEAKKPTPHSHKRKRYSSVTTRKRNSTQKASNLSISEDHTPEKPQQPQQRQQPHLGELPLEDIIVDQTVAHFTIEHSDPDTTPTRPVTPTTPTTPIATVVSAVSPTTTPATSNSYVSVTPTTALSLVSPGGGRKRSRGGGMSVYERSSGVVTNGYLSSTRTSSASSSAVHSEADPQDLAHQFYVPVPAASSSGVSTNASVSSATISSGGPSSNLLTHAPSMATLCNIGNTCYLNSVVYTLRFAPKFLHNLHHLIVDLTNIQQSIARQRTKSSSLGRGISATQLEGARSWSSKDLAALEQTAIAATGVAGNAATGGYTQKSSHQLLTERLHELYQSLHRNEVTESTEPFHADTLLHAIQDVSAIFEGNQQQDAHEFLMCVLNSIRETCQTLIKAIADCPDVILNSYIRGTDELDSSSGQALSPNSHLGGSGSGVSSVPAPASATTSTTSSSSLSASASNITKALFSSRKAKRKEEARNAKNSRLQSPLKDTQSGGVLQPTANSLFYLNSVDLSGAVSATNTNATYTPTSGSGGAGDGDISPVSLLKDKERLAEKIRELGLDFFSEDFEGVTVSTTKCLSCETVTEQKESMIDIAVPVPISGYDTADYAEKPSSFIQNSCITREYFRGENKYRCEQCTGYTEAIRSISYEVLPRLLVIQLSRFSGGMEKINSYIPTSFTLQCFCSKCCELSEGNKLHIYKLYSVITHVGATMSVGHYIAYTCALDNANEYVNCPKDRRMTPGPQAANASASVTPNNGQTTNAPAATSSSSGSGERASLIKKMKFGRSKASSSGDMSKNMKSLNGLTSKAITNGIGKLSMNTTCHSLNCCATRLCCTQQQLLQMSNNPDYSEETFQNSANSVSGYASSSGGSSNPSSNYGSYPAGYGSTGRGGAKTAYNVGSNMTTANNSEPIWYMCDDDKIKAMTQREFEELLSPARKITVTPYLLFYARFDLQTPQPSSAKSTSGTPIAATTAQTWSSDSGLSGSASSSSKM